MDFDEKYPVPWKDTACLGFVIAAMENLCYGQRQIAEMVYQLKELFDWLTVEEADGKFTDSKY